MRRQRTIYYNDARHYYLFVFEPPMTLEDARRPVDEVAGTAVDTFIYGVARNDGMFYDTKVGKRFGVDARPFVQNNHWRTWANMQSLIDRGLDPLDVLIDRAHDKGMEFFASLRMSSYGATYPELSVAQGGRGLAEESARAHVFAVLEELATQHDVEGLELDFSAAPSGMDYWLRPRDVEEHTATITGLVTTVSDMVRDPGRRGEIGARVYPTEAMNLAQGLDVRGWLREGLVDFVVPVLYAYFDVDGDMPVEWLIEAAHEADVAVYGMLQRYVHGPATGSERRIYLTPEIARAAGANLRDKGVDGLYTWSMRWPLGDAERSILTELGDPELAKEGDKRHVVRRRSQQAAELGYDAPLPLEITTQELGTRHAVPFYIADDFEAPADRIAGTTLRLNISNTVSEDRFTLLLNGQSLSEEACRRLYGTEIGPRGMWLELDLKDVRPVKGRNVLEISLDGRPAELEGWVALEEVEVVVEYGPYPSSLRRG